MCSRMYCNATLAASHLPAPLQERIRADFNGKTFEPADLTERIDADRSLLIRTDCRRRRPWTGPHQRYVLARKTR